MNRTDLLAWFEMVLALTAVAGAVLLWRRRGRTPSDKTEASRDAPAPAVPVQVDEVTGLPDLGFLRGRFAVPPDEKQGAQPLTLLTISLAEAGDGGESDERALMEVAHTVRSILRAGDTCVRGEQRQLMAVLPGLDLHTSATLVARIRHAVDSLTLVTRSGGEVRLAVQVGRSCVPQDGDDLEALLAGARNEARRGGHEEDAGRRLSRAVPMVPN